MKAKRKLDSGGQQVIIFANLACISEISIFRRTGGDAEYDSIEESRYSFWARVVQCIKDVLPEFNSFTFC